MKYKLLAAFPGCGKSYFAENNFRVKDSDSSQFSKAGFPENYLKALKIYNDNDISCLISTHGRVQQALEVMEIPYMLVYPHISLIEEYRQRYLNRDGFNGSETFVNRIMPNWHSWIAAMDESRWPNKRVLHAGEYLSDIVSLDDSGCFQWKGLRE